MDTLKKVFGEKYEGEIMPNGVVHKVGGVVVGVLLYHYWMQIYLVVLIAVVGSAIPDMDLWLPLFKHRGILHSLIGAGIVAGLFAYLIYQIGVRPELAYALFAGYLSHLLLDMFTPRGVRLFQPIF